MLHAVLIHVAVVIVGECVMVESESISQMIGSAVWCLTCHNDVVIAGCRNGSIEVLTLLLNGAIFNYFE